MTQQTAVEWLVEKLEESGIYLMKDELEMVEQARAMHKIETILFAQKMQNKKSAYVYTTLLEHYNQTFKQ
jgi:hypothetical protein